MSTDDMWWVNHAVAFVWVLLAAYGVMRRIVRMHHLRQIILPEPLEQEDVDYLASVKRSTRLRLTAKVILLIGGLIALFDLTDYRIVWWLGVVAILIVMDLETVSVDQVRARLAHAYNAGKGD